MSKLIVVTPLVMVIVFLGVVSAFCYDQDPLLLIEDAAGMFNERGYLKSNSFSLDGEEIINDFNGNLIWTKRLQYRPFSQNGLSFDLKITYNGSVGHVVNAGLDKINNPDECGPNSVNLPEWIISVNNIAIQTFNFENEAVSFNTVVGVPLTQHNDVAALINGYHTCYSHCPTPTGEHYGNISILMGDGSVRQFISDRCWSPTGGIVEGTYHSFSKDDRAKGYVDANKDFTLFLENGTKVFFKHYLPKWKTTICDIHPTLEAPHIFLPTKFSDVTGWSFIVEYYDSSAVTCGYGRPPVKKVNWIPFNWVTSIYGVSQLMIDGHSLFPGTGELCYINFVPYGGSLASDCQRVNRAEVASISDILGRETSFSYDSYSRTGQEFADCEVCAIDFDYPWVRVEGDFQLALRRLREIQYPTGGRSTFTYYGPDTLSVNFRQWTNPEHYPRIKSSLFQTFGRDPFFINMVKSREQRNEYDQLVCKDSLHFSWYEAVDTLLYRISEDDRFYTTRTSMSTDPDSCKTLTFVYSYYSEPAPYSSESRDRGWLIKQLSLKEKQFDGVPYTVPTGLLSTYGEECRETYNYWNHTTKLLDSTKTVTDGVGGTIRFERSFLGVEYDPKVSNIRWESQENDFGVVTVTRYDTLRVSVNSPEVYYNNANVSCVEVWDSYGNLCALTRTEYYDGTCSLGFVGQPSITKQYLIDEVSSEAVDSFLTTYEYHRETDPVYYRRNGDLCKVVSPEGDSTVYHYYDRVVTTGLGYDDFPVLRVSKDSLPYVINPVTYLQASYDGTVTSVDGQFITPVHSWYKAVRFVGLDSIEYCRELDEEGKPTRIVDANRYISSIQYDPVDRVSKIILPGDFEHYIAPGETLWIDTVIYPICDAELELKPVYYHCGNVVNYDGDSLSLGYYYGSGTDIWIRDAVFSFKNFDPYHYNIVIDSAFFNFYCLSGYEYMYCKIATTYNDPVDKNYICRDSTHEQLCHLNNVGWYRQNVTADVASWATNSTKKHVIDIHPQGRMAFQSSTLATLGNVIIASVDHQNTGLRPWLKVYGHVEGSLPDTTYTIRYEYDDSRILDGTISVSRMVRPDTLAFAITTRALLDGFGRPVRTDFIDSVGTYDYVSTMYDYAGRISRTVDQLGYATIKRYDNLDRKVETVFPDVYASRVQVSYSGCDTAGHGFPSDFEFPNSGLYRTQYTDENARSTYEYTDVLGRLRLRRQFCEGSVLNTYFNYDALGNLTKVIRPNGDMVTYKYNSLGWLPEEYSADYGTILYRYDSEGKLIRRRDAKLAAKQGGNWWSFNEYDAVNRITTTGLFDSTSTAFQPMQQFFYDQQCSSNSKGRLSISLSTPLADDYGEQYDYDPRGRLVRQRNIFRPFLAEDSGQYHLERGFVESHEHAIGYEYNHADQVTSIMYPDSSIVTYYYDDRGRLASVGDGLDQARYATINYTPRNEIATMTLGSGLQTMDYAYNERGWLTEINNGYAQGGTYGDLFGQQLYYYSHPFYSDSSMYNGNLVGQKIAIADDPVTTYLYSYDPLDRLKSAYLCETQTMLEQFGYDLNGNRLTYVQDNWGTREYGYELGTNRLLEITGSVDSLDNTFSYDENGNVKTDQAKNATFNYDVYNQLETVVVEGPYGDNTLTFGYNNAGERVLKRYHYYYRVLCTNPPNPKIESSPEPQGSVPNYERSAHSYGEPEITLEAGKPPAQYCTFDAEVETYYVRGSGGKVLAEYIKDNVGYRLQRKYIYAGDQRIAMVDADGKVFFYLNDHLGSARVVVREQSNPNQDPVADKYSEYWAFGADADITVQTGQPFKYTGQPFDNEGGLGLYYYGARYYDPVLGRFMAVDPLAAKYPQWSPYVYTKNNPLRYVDPDGRYTAESRMVTLRFPNGRMEPAMIWEPRWTTRADRIMAALLPYPASLIFEPDGQIDILKDGGEYVLKAAEYSGESLVTKGAGRSALFYVQLGITAYSVLVACDAPVDPNELRDMYDEMWGDSQPCESEACVHERVAAAQKKLNSRNNQSKKANEQTNQHGRNKSKRFEKSATERDYGEAAARLREE